MAGDDAARGALRAAVALYGRPALPARRREAPADVPDLARLARRPLRLAPAGGRALGSARISPRALRHRVHRRRRPARPPVGERVAGRRWNTRRGIEAP